MKKKTILWSLLAVLPVMGFAQSDDDMYFVPKKSKTEATAFAAASSTRHSEIQNTEDKEVAEYYSGALRDVDEYNRRSGSGRTVTIITDTDTFNIDESQLTLNEEGKYVIAPQVEEQNEAPSYYDYDDDFAYSVRLARFHGIGYPYYGYGLYSPWHYDSWYYDPWYYGWRGWYGGYYGWYDPWYTGWYYPYHYHYYHGGYYAGGGYRTFNGGRGYGRTISPGRGSVATTRTYGSAGRGRSMSSTVQGTRGERSAHVGRTGSTHGVSTRQSTVSRQSTSSSRSYSTTSRGSRGSYSGSSSRGSSFSGSGSRGSSFSGGGGFSGGSRGGGGFSGGGSRGGGRR